MPAVSMAWGPWSQAAGMTSQLEAADIARLQRTGVLALTPKQGLELFDAALLVGEALVLPVRLDAVALRARARAGELHALLRGLIHVPVRRSESAVSGSLQQRLAGLSGVECERVVLGLVRGEVAGVLGHVSAEMVPAGRAFKELGFDSLAAVELRNRLAGCDGVAFGEYCGV